MHGRHFFIFIISCYSLQQQTYNSVYIESEKENDKSKNYQVYLRQNNFTKTSSIVAEQRFCTLLTRTNQTTVGRMQTCRYESGSSYAWANWCCQYTLANAQQNGLKLESFQYNSAHLVCNNANQSVSLPWRIHFDLVNRNAEGTFFTICKNQALCFITALNEGMSKLKVKYTKSTWILILYVKIITI